MADGAAEDEFEGFDPFSGAERAAEEAVNLILEEGGQQLYEKYIEKKSFSFASQVVSKLLVSELRMCYVSFDRGEPSARAAAAAAAAEAAAAGSPTAAGAPPVALAAPEDDPDLPRCGWDLEPEPPRCRIDTWARACVPIRRKIVQSKAGPAQEESHAAVKRQNTKKAPGSPKVASGASQGRSPSRQHMSTINTSSGDSEQAKSMQRSMQAIPLTEDRDEDEEEAEMRERKEREARRRREEESRMQQKAAQEAEEVARLAQVKDQMKNKPFTYDATGNVLWIQPPQPHKLPPAHPVPSYTFKTKEAPGQHLHETNPRPARGGHGGKLERGKKDKELVDSFKRFASQQPSMIESMKLAAGVVLNERGRTKHGAQIDRRGLPMSRKEYEEMVASGSAKGGPLQAPGERDGSPSAASRAPSVPASAGGASAPAEEERAAAEAAQSSPGKDAAATPSAGMSRVVRGPDKGAELVPRAPDKPRPVQPVPPPTFRRAQMKRDALGYSLSTRERVATTTASRFPGCAAQPPLGATMGHGLASGLQRPDEFYFPGAGPSLGLGDDSIHGEDMPGSPTSSRPAHGQIVSSNPQLVKQIFSGR